MKKIPAASAAAVSASFLFVKFLLCRPARVQQRYSILRTYVYCWYRTTTSKRVTDIFLASFHLHVMILWGGGGGGTSEYHRLYGWIHTGQPDACVHQPAPPPPSNVFFSFLLSNSIRCSRRRFVAYSVLIIKYFVEYLAYNQLLLFFVFVFLYFHHCVFHSFK